MNRALLVVSLLLSGCTAEPEDTARDTDPGPSPYSLDDTLRWNHIQAKGTHNSYHLEPDTLLSPEHAYSQPPLDVQLQEHGVRQFEIDLHYRDGQGFEVFHIPAIDQETTCVAFHDCLWTIRTWSDAHPWHAPITVWLELKEEGAILDETLLEHDGRYEELERAILMVFPHGRVIKPDDVRGSHPDLKTALATDGFPTLGELRGRIAFSLLESGEHRDAYLEGHAELEDRLMFVNGSTEDSFTALLKINDGESASARDAVAAGYIVTSNEGLVDTPDDEAQASVTAAWANGVQHISTDLPGPVEGREFYLQMPYGEPV
ncbi:MAG: hypothetical protein KC912_26290, partial [Proteobacteria bacterium]|nr:hypothetical protein [Pseudomonadota bacterium]